MKKGAIYFIGLIFIFGLSGCGKEVKQKENKEYSVVEEKNSQPSVTKDAEIENSLQPSVTNNTVKENDIKKKDSQQLLESENKYSIVQDEDVNVYSDVKKYGRIKKKHKKFKRKDGKEYFYYDMECFYFNDDYPAVLNDTLQRYYDSQKESYENSAKTYSGESDNAPNVPYDSLIFQYFTYIGDDYVSMVFNDVTYMGGAHQYSKIDGVTIDCNTGEMVDVNQFINDTDEEINKQFKELLGIAEYDNKEWDFYITDKNVVFFYYDSRFWDSVETKRVR